MWRHHGPQPVALRPVLRRCRHQPPGAACRGRLARPAASVRRGRSRLAPPADRPAGRPPSRRRRRLVRGARRGRLARPAVWPASRPPIACPPQIARKSQIEQYLDCYGGAPGVQRNGCWRSAVVSPRRGHRRAELGFQLRRKDACSRRSPRPALPRAVRRAPSRRWVSGRGRRCGARRTRPLDALVDVPGRASWSYGFGVVAVCLLHVVFVVLPRVLSPVEREHRATCG